MKRKSIIIVVLLSAVIMASWGCGGGPGSPGSSNTEDTGVTLEATIIPTYLGNNTKDVDAVQDICSDPGVTPVLFEPFTEHGATVTITARLLNPNAQFTPGVLFIEKYTIEYRRSNDSIGSPPILFEERFDSIAIPPPTGSGTTTVTASVIFVDLRRKFQYEQDMTSGQFTPAIALINNYTALYTFEGKNSFGKSFSFKAQTDLTIGNFDNCQ